MLSQEALEQINTKIENLESKLQGNSSNFKTCFALLECYKQVSLFDKANALRLKMSFNITFSEAQWLNWITEEMTEAYEDKPKKKSILKIFDLSFEEGYFPEVGQMYLKFTNELLEEGLITKSNVKSMTEKAIGAFCHDFIAGAKIFKLAREIEFDFQKRQATAPTTNERLKKDSDQIIRNLYQRELKLGLNDFDKTFAEYSAWEKDVTQITKTKSIANEILNNLFKINANFAQSFTTSEDKLEFIRDLINTQAENQKSAASAKTTENANSQMAISGKIIVFFERTLTATKFSEQSQIWKDYVKFVKDQGSPVQVLSRVMRRASKICIDDLDLHAEYLRVLEKLRAPIETVQKEVDRLVGMHSGQVDEQYILWSGYLSYCVRQLKVNDDISAYSENTNDKSKKDSINPNNLAQLRSAYSKVDAFFQDVIAAANRSNQEKESQDQSEINSCKAYIEEITLKHAEVETYIVKDYNVMEAIMEPLMKIRGDTLASWKKYYEFERAFDRIQQMRSILKRACEYVRDEVYEAYQAYVEFESDYGDIDLVEAAIGKQIAKMIEMNEESNNANKENELGEDEDAEKEEMDKIEQELEDEDKENHHKKGKHIKKQHKEKEQNDDDDSASGSDSDLSLSSYSGEISQEDSGEEEEIEFEKNTKKGQSKKRKNEHADSEEASQPHKKPKLSQDQTDQHGDKPTIFVKNLPHDSTEPFICALFPNKAHVTAVRIVKGKFGEGKGFAYVDFTSVQEAQAACQSVNDKVLPGNRKLYVAMSAPPKKQQTSEESNNSTAFLTNLPFQVTEAEITTALKNSSATINQIRIIRDDSGRCRGFAYVEFVNEQDLLSAIEKFNENPFIGKRKITMEKADKKAKKRDEYHNRDMDSGENGDGSKHSGQDNSNAKNLTVFLKNLGYKSRESDLKEFFSDCQIESITIAKDDIGQPKGFGFIVFNDKQSLETALAKQQGTIKGKTFEILKYNKPPPKRDAEKIQVEAKQNKSNEDFRKLFN